MSVYQDRKCATQKCKKEEDAYNKLSKKIQIGSNPKGAYDKLLKSTEMKNMNKCYEQNCPNYIRHVMNSQKITAT